MVQRMMNTLPLVLAVCAAFSAAGATNEGGNAADLYRPAFSNIEAWATTHAGFGRAPTNVTGPDAAEAYAALQPELEALRAAETATHCDWGTRFEDGMAALLPHVAPANKAQRASLWAAHYALSNNLPGFADHAMDAVRVARNVGEDGLLLDLLVQVAGEKPALELLAQHIDRLDAKQRAALEEGLKSLPPGATMVETMQMEKALFVDTLIRQLLQAMREADTNLFERTFAGDPVTAGTNAAGAVSGERSSETLAPSWIVENLRFTSIVDAGRGWRIGFETKDGDQFMVAFGRPARGIELLSVDYGREEAVIARSNETALVKLKTRELQPLRLRFRWPAPEERQRIMGDAELLRKNPVLALIAGIDALGGSENAPEEFFRQTGGTPEGLLALLTRTSEEYAGWIDAFQRLPPADFKIYHADLAARGTLFTRLMLPAVDKVIEKESSLRAARLRLTEALAVQRAK